MKRANFLHYVYIGQKQKKYTHIKLVINICFALKFQQKDSTQVNNS